MKVDDWVYWVQEKELPSGFADRQLMKGRIERIEGKEALIRLPGLKRCRRVLLSKLQKIEV